MAKSVVTRDVGSSAGAVEIASQSDMETATSTTKATAPGRQHYHPSAAKAWAAFQNDGTILASYNVASIGKNGTGDFTINIGTDFSSANYVGVAMSGANSGVGSLLTSVVAITAGTFRIQVKSGAGSVTDPDTPNLVMAVFFGDQ